MKALPFVLALTGCMGTANLTPMELADVANTNAWWVENASTYAGATWCIGNRGSVTQISPFLKVDSATRALILKHEHQHQRQMHRLGCKRFQQMYVTPDGVAALEIEAYQVQGLDVLQTVAMLSRHPQLRNLSSNELLMLVRKYWAQNHDVMARQ